jgi:hypothetical protein
MKNILILCAVILVAGSALVWRVAAKPNRFGKFTGAPHAEIAAVLDRPAEFAGHPVALEGTVTAQCKATGCFFSLRSGIRAVRVDLQDLAGHFPNNEGRLALVEGQLQERAGAWQLYASAVEFK